MMELQRVGADTNPIDIIKFCDCSLKFSTFLLPLLQETSERHPQWAMHTHTGFHCHSHCHLDYRQSISRSIDTGAENQKKKKKMGRARVTRAAAEEEEHGDEGTTARAPEPKKVSLYLLALLAKRSSAELTHGLWLVLLVLVLPNRSEGCPLRNCIRKRCPREAFGKCRRGQWRHRVEGDLGEVPGAGTEREVFGVFEFVKLLLEFLRILVPK